MKSVSPGLMIIVALIAWRIVRRVRSNIGRQKLRPGRIITSLVILGLASMLILGMSVALPGLALGISGGMLTGGALAFLALRLTKFETELDGHYYTPNIYIGLGVSTLIMCRIAWRMFQLQNVDAATTNPQALQSPLTMFIAGLTIGYYLAFYIGLFVHTHDRKPAPLA